MDEVVSVAGLALINPELGKIKSNDGAGGFHSNDIIKALEVSLKDNDAVHVVNYTSNIGASLNSAMRQNAGKRYFVFPYTIVDEHNIAVVVDTELREMRVYDHQEDTRGRSLNDTSLKNIAQSLGFGNAVSSSSNGSNAVFNPNIKDGFIESPYLPQTDIWACGVYAVLAIEDDIAREGVAIADVRKHAPDLDAAAVRIYNDSHLDIRLEQAAMEEVLGLWNDRYPDVAPDGWLLERFKTIPQNVIEDKEKRPQLENYLAALKVYRDMGGNKQRYDFESAVKDVFKRNQYNIDEKDDFVSAVKKSYPDITQENLGIIFDAYFFEIKEFNLDRDILRQIVHNTKELWPALKNNNPDFSVNARKAIQTVQSTYTENKFVEAGGLSGQLRQLRDQLVPGMSIKAREDIVSAVLAIEHEHFVSKLDMPDENKALFANPETGNKGVFAAYLYKNLADPDFIDFLREHIDYLSLLSVKEPEDQVMFFHQFPPLDAEFYECVPGSKKRQSDVTNVLVGRDIFSAAIINGHNTATQYKASELARDYPIRQGLHVHLPVMLDYVAGVSREEAAKKDQHFDRSIKEGQVPLQEMGVFLNSYAEQLSENAANYILEHVAQILSNMDVNNPDPTIEKLTDFGFSDQMDLFDIVAMGLPTQTDRYGTPIKQLSPEKIKHKLINNVNLGEFQQVGERQEILGHFDIESDDFVQETAKKILSEDLEIRAQGMLALWLVGENFKGGKPAQFAEILYLIGQSIAIPEKPETVGRSAIFDFILVNILKYRAAGNPVADKLERIPGIFGDIEKIIGLRPYLSYLEAGGPAATVNANVVIGSACAFGASYSFIAEILKNNAETIYHGDIFIILAKNNYLSAVQNILENPEELAKIYDGGVGGALMGAAEKGCAGVAQAILSNPAALDKIIPRDMALVLRYAAEAGNVSIVKAILKNPGAMDKLPEEEIGMALLAAATNRHAEVVKAILENDEGFAKVTTLYIGKVLDSASRDGDITICDAILGNDVVMARYREVPQQYLEYMGRALEAAAENGHLAVFNAIAKIYDEKIGQALRAAAKNGHIEVVNAILDNNALFAKITTEDLGESLLGAAENGGLAVFNAIFSNPEFTKVVHIYTGEALFRAAQGGRTAIVNAILDNLGAFADGPEYIRQSLVSVALRGHADVVHAILGNAGAFAEITSQNMGLALQSGVKGGRRVVVNAILGNEDAFAKVTPEDMSGAFMAAAEAPHTATIFMDMLEDRLVMAKVKSEDLGKVLLVSIINDRTNIVRAILNNNAMNNHVVEKITPQDMGRALVAAAENNHGSVAKTMLQDEDIMEKISDVDMGRALVAAAENGCRDIVGYILEYPEAFAKVTPEYMDRALNMAVAYGHREIYSMLEDKARNRAETSVAPSPIASSSQETPASRIAAELSRPKSSWGESVSKKDDKGLGCIIS